jgi:hypothetical protein
MKSSLVPFPGEVVRLSPPEQVSSWVVCRVLVGREARACSPAGKRVVQSILLTPVLTLQL